MLKKFSPVIELCLLSLFYTLAWLIFRGYIFNTADQGESLSLVYARLNDQLYPHDFYVQSAKEIFTIRYCYVELLAFLGQWISVPILCLIIEIVLISSSIAAWLKIARYFMPNSDNYASTVPFFILFIFYGWTVGGNSIQYPLLISSTFAKSFAPWSLYFALRQKWFISAVLLGIATLFQLLVGLQLFIILSALLLIHLRQFKQFFYFLWGYTMFASAMLLPILYRQFLGDGSHAPELFYEILYRLRNPHHYLPSLFPFSHYIKLLVLMMAGNACLYALVRGQLRKALFAFQGWILLGLIAYYLLLEPLDILAIGKIQWFKTTIWLSAISAFMIGLAVDKLIYYFSARKWIWVVALPILWILQGHFRFGTPITFDHRNDEEKQLTKVHEWIRKNTPNDALFATFPRDESFICEAQRSQYVAWNPIIHEPWYLLEWKKRYDILYQQPFNAENYLSTLDKAAENYANNNFMNLPCQYALVDTLQLKKIERPYTVLHRQNNWVVLKLSH